MPHEGLHCAVFFSGLLLLSSSKAQIYSSTLYSRTLSAFSSLLKRHTELTSSDYAQYHKKTP